MQTETSAVNDFALILATAMALVAVIVMFFKTMVTAILEPAFVFVFNRPLYVHVYPIKKRLTDAHRAQLRRDCAFYGRLTPQRKAWFDHRVARFIARYGFEGRDGLSVTDDMKVAVASAHVMLTFGMRNYLPPIIKGIILYPDIYYSPFTGTENKGEFNPQAGIIVFSWRHFEEGSKMGNDNLHVGIHEFSHLMHVYGSRRNDTSSVIFSDMYREILDGLRQPGAMERVQASGYFRDYAFTNEYEFLAVILEHFFETPDEFRQQFPLLYKKVAKMINYREVRSGDFS